MTSKKNLFIGIFLFSGFLLSLALHPTRIKISEPVAKIDLEQMFPKEFSGWKLDETVVPLQIDPERFALLNKIYNQTLTRTYIKNNDERIMLSIAYGGDFSDSMQLHRPEVCYAAQGFIIQEKELIDIDTGFGLISGRRLVATTDKRYEPITYWINVGHKVSLRSIHWKLEKLKFLLTGKVAGGILFRVSSLGEKDHAYKLQQDFIKDILNSIDQSDRKLLIGVTTQ